MGRPGFASGSSGGGDCAEFEGTNTLKAKNKKRTCLKEPPHPKERGSGPRQIEKTGQSPVEFLARHVTGDWGELPVEDRTENFLSVEQGFRVLSSYRTLAGERIWVITEADRSLTTLLLPDEY